MVIKVYTSGISGNKEVKKRQQRIMMILDSKNIKYQAIDITEPGNEEKKQFMQDNAKATDSKHPLPPQIFNEEDYCGDYIGFDLANENDELEIFLKMPLPATPAPQPIINGREEEPSVHGFCYTPGLAKRIEKALKARIRKPLAKSIHGYCYTPSLAQRLVQAIAKSVKMQGHVDGDSVQIDEHGGAIGDHLLAHNDDDEIQVGLLFDSLLASSPSPQYLAM